MEKFEGWFKTYRPSLDTSAIEAEFIFEAGQQSRQAEVDALNDNHLAYIDKVIAMESDYLEKIEEKDKRINQALNFINNWWHPDLDQKLFVEALGRALRGEHE